MTEGMPEVEEGAFSGRIVGVGNDNARLGANAMLDCGLANFAISTQYFGAIRFAPGKKIWVVDQAIFDDLGIAGPQLAGIERIEQRRVGNDEQGMMERA